MINVYLRTKGWRGKQEVNNFWLWHLVWSSSEVNVLKVVIPWEWTGGRGTQTMHLSDKISSYKSKANKICFKIGFINFFAKSRFRELCAKNLKNPHFYCLNYVCFVIRKTQGSCEVLNLLQNIYLFCYFISNFSEAGAFLILWLKSCKTKRILNFS